MGEWQKLTAEAATLEKLVQVHRLQHRRTGYFARVLDVRRGVRAVLGKGAHLAQVEQALHAIRAAWKDLQSLLIQTYFMPYAKELATCRAIPTPPPLRFSAPTTAVTSPPRAITATTGSRIL